MNFESDIPTIFPTEITALVSKRNLSVFPPFGFSPGGAVSWGNPLQLHEHRVLLANALGLPHETLRFQRQTHGAVVRVVGKHTAGADESDGMITDEAEVALCISLADCAAILAYDPNTRTLGAFHSGWRGTQQKISQTGLIRMAERFGADPKEILVYVSACAGGRAYQVGEEVARYFPDSVIPADNGKFLLDVRNEIRRQVIDIGIMPEHIEVSESCTITDERYHSFRRDGRFSGRMAAAIVLKSA